MQAHLRDRPGNGLQRLVKPVDVLGRGTQGLVVVDIVTNRLANLHNEVIGLFGLGEPFVLPPSATT